MLKKRAFWIVLAAVLVAAAGGAWYAGLLPGLPGPRAVAVADTTGADSTLAAAEDAESGEPDDHPTGIRMRFTVAPATAGRYS